MHRDRIAALLAVLASLAMTPTAVASGGKHHYHRVKFTLAPNGRMTVQLGRHENIQLTSLRVNGDVLLTGDQQGDDATMYGDGAVFRFTQTQGYGRLHRFAVHAASVADRKLHVVVTYYGYNSPR